MPSQLTHLDADEVRSHLTPAGAVAALRQALQNGFDPATDAPRQITELPAGQVLTMPSQLGSNAGIKLLTLTPQNAARGLPLIQGMYVLFDGDTLTPTHLLDGEAITDVRTPAVSVAATLDALTATDAPARIVIFGAGHQGLGHARTLKDLLRDQRAIESCATIVRSPSKVAQSADVREAFDGVLASDSDEARQAIEGANVIVCATTSSTPLFDGRIIRDDAVIMAVGSHSPDARELDSVLMRRADVVVEDVETALRECGDVVLALKDGAFLVDALIPMADYVTGRRAPRPGRPLVFKSSGMSWEDLVIAQAVVDASER